MDDNKKMPTKDDLRANNRESRLAKGWAHICNICNRKFTTHSGINNHMLEKHKHLFYQEPGKVETK